MKNKLNKLIPPEIKDGKLFYLIKELVLQETPLNVLEIGSSSGEGSTLAFVQSMQKYSPKTVLYCLEISQTRFQKLHNYYKALPSVRCYNDSSVSINKFLSKNEVISFYNRFNTNLNQYSLELVLRWLDDDIEYIKNSNVSQNGIRKIKNDNCVINFDMVLIDGSAFSACAELDEVYGSKIILLDDINDIKNYQNYQLLDNDSFYELIFEDWNLRNGFAVFKRIQQTLSIHFFTIVLNGEPFIEYHFEILKKLPVPWHWHIIEGVAALNHDTAWSLRTGGTIPSGLHRNGISIDGTSEYLEKISSQYPENVSLYRKPVNVFWDGKLEMIRAPLRNITGQHLLWEIDADELWTVEQIKKTYHLFLNNPDHTAAYFYCYYFVGKGLLITSRNTYGNYSHMEWLRVWKYQPGCDWISHEPPKLCRTDSKNNPVDMSTIKPFLHDTTSAEGLIFQHYPYVMEEQLAFKEKYYGYKNAVKGWRKLQKANTFPVYLKKFFPWVKDDAVVDRAESKGIQPIFTTDKTGKRYFHQP